MKNRTFDFLFPVVGGSAGATSPIWSTITWSHVGELAIEAAILAVVGGIVGWSMKKGLDKLAQTINAHRRNK